MTRPRGDEPPPISVSPWTQEFRDTDGHVIRISVLFDPITRALLGAVAYRSGKCAYTRILIGLGPDGTPDSTPDVFVVPAGVTNVAAAALRRNALRTIEDVLALQITATW